MRLMIFRGRPQREQINGSAPWTFLISATSSCGIRPSTVSGVSVHADVCVPAHNRKAGQSEDRFPSVALRRNGVGLAAAGDLNV
jgi:hypothetical protein